MKLILKLNKQKKKQFSALRSYSKPPKEINKMMFYLKSSNNIYSTKLNLINTNHNNRYNLLFRNEKYY